MATPIPTWKERLASAFSFRHRLLHVFGAPAALGAVAAVATASALNPEVGLSMGVLTAGVTSLIAGYWVTAGFDTSLNRQLMRDKELAAQQAAAAQVQSAVATAEPELQPALQRILWFYDSVIASFNDGKEDRVEAILKNSVDDLEALRDRALALSSFLKRLSGIIQSSNGGWLEAEVQRMDRELEGADRGPARDALQAARDGRQRMLEQWNAAVEKQKQIRHMLTVVETNLQEFKMAMELRKADAAMGSSGVGEDVSELQARLIAAGEACDELVGRRTSRTSRVGRRRA